MINRRLGLLFALFAPGLAVYAAPAITGTAEAPGSVVAAAKNGDVRALKALIARKADVNATAADTSTALHWAVQNENLDFVNLLLTAGAKVDVATRYKVTPLSIAASNGNAAIIERLIKAGADANSTAEDGQTVLMTAALNGRLDALRMLLKNGAKVNAIEPYRGQTALMWAAGEGNAGAAELLMEFGADVKAKSKAGYTALLLAVLNDKADAAKMLISHGANIEEKAPDGTTALNMATVNAYYDIASMLLDLGANPNAPDPRGSALHTVVWLRKPGTSWEAAGLGQDPETVPRPEGKVTAMAYAEKLLQKGANPNARVDFKEMAMTKGLGTTRNPPNVNLGRHHLSFVGSTPFYNAARNGDAPMMKLLVKYGADPKIPTAVGVTPLMAAACLDYYEGESPGPRTGVSEAERLEAVKLAYELGGDINAKTTFGNYKMSGTPEYTLLTYPDDIEPLFLLGIGDPRWDGMTAIHAAVISNQPSILQFIVDHGGDPEIKNRLGWTPMMVAKGIFMANSKKEFPWAVEILEKAIAAKHQPGKVAENLPNKAN